MTADDASLDEIGTPLVPPPVPPPPLPAPPSASSSMQRARSPQCTWGVQGSVPKRTRRRRVLAWAAAVLGVLVGGVFALGNVLQLKDATIVAAGRAITRAEQKERALGVIEDYVAAVAADDSEKLCSLVDSSIHRARGDHPYFCAERYDAFGFRDDEREAARAGFDPDAVDVVLDDDLPGFACLSIPGTAWYDRSALAYDGSFDVCVFEERGRWFMETVNEDAPMDLELFAAGIMVERLQLEPGSG
ncbi:hypothetical protein [Flavimobilis soli]|uniref:hypothetical protein n=1 Tax=Flavimobilis soli TaxID=442709 RepID=UPI00117A565B|nr:hypothetical protein [Flavimobilis soli]